MGDSVTLAWNRNPEAEVCGYNVYVSDRSPGMRARVGLVPVRIECGNATNFTVTNLAAGRTYWFYVTAITRAGLESEPSGVVQYSVPGLPPEPPGVRVWLEVATDLGGPWSNVVAFCWSNPVAGFWRARVEAR